VQVFAQDMLACEIEEGEESVLEFPAKLGRVVWVVKAQAKVAVAVFRSCSAGGPIQAEHQRFVQVGEDG
jgi:hypothetical protein